MTAATQYAASNETYAAGFGKGDLALPPSQKVAIVTCMDARIDPAAALGIPLGGAHVIRNAGGRTPEALRSLVISQQLLGTTEIVVVQHTDCGMLTFENKDIRAKVQSNLGVSAESIDFLPFPDLEQNVRDDVKFLRDSSLLLEESKAKITGWVYDVKTGKITNVV